MIIKLNSQNQITISKSVREKLNIKAGDQLLMDVQENMLILLPRPKSYTNYLQGLHSEIWEIIDSEKYLGDERKAWH